MNTVSMTRDYSFALGAFLLLAFFAVAPLQTHAAGCSFTRDLKFGDVGPDVLCLQKYLNGTGYIISTTGAGSPGKETDEYKTLTEKAVTAWQEAQGLQPATGYFGAKSRAKYESLVLGTSVPSLTPVTPTTQPLTGTSVQKPVVPSVSAGETEARTAVKAAILAYTEAKKEIDDEDDAKKQQAAEELLDDSQNNLFTAMMQYMNGTYGSVAKLSEKSKKQSNTAVRELDGRGDDDDEDDNSDEDSADEALEEAEDALADAEDAIEEADDDGEEVDAAEKLLKKAEKAIDDANDAYDEEDYGDAEKLAKKGKKYAKDAEDAIGEEESDDEEDEDDTKDVEDRLEDARDDLQDAQDDLESAQDDGEETGDAEDLLDDAEDYLDDAEDVLDDDEDEAEDLIKKAEKKIKKALDEF